jgi:3-hydroxy-3-methylglutaryl CoA synthase
MAMAKGTRTTKASGSDTGVGITAFGCYLPRLRLSREAVVAANGWSNAALRAYRKGARAMCNWDEDALTLAVAAARDCLNGTDAAALTGILLASTSLPFADRQNAGIVANALMMSSDVLSLDVTASQKAGTSALVAALELAQARGEGQLLLVAADQRHTKVASAQELWYGDGAAALTLGSQGVLARYLGGVSRTVDFVDHYRSAEREYDYTWEERWIRDEGYGKIVPPAVQALLAKTGVKAGEVRFFAMPSVFGPVPAAVAKAAGLPPESVRDTLFAACGETGAAHPLVLLIDALQEAQPGDKVLVVGFGQGCDALLFEATEALADYPGRAAGRGVKGALAAGREETNYQKFLTFTHQLTKELGIRAEADVPTPLSALYRKRDMVFGLMGGRCSACGTAQFPATEVCVNPECKAVGTQEPLSFADRPAHVKTWTADYLTFTLDPPGYYGMVEFDEGGRFIADFTDVDGGQVDVGMPVSMAFRLKSIDERRGMRRYFWKAVPRKA